MLIDKSQFGSVEAPHSYFIDERQTECVRVAVPLIDSGGLTSDSGSNEISACGSSERESCFVILTQRGCVSGGTGSFNCHSLRTACSSGAIADLQRAAPVVHRRGVALLRVAFQLDDRARRSSL
jgi:hypothetical protein